MSLAQVLPEVQSLSRLVKLRLIQFLAQELERESGGMIEPGRSCPVSSPDRAFTAAAALLQALQQDKGSHECPGPAVSVCAARPVLGQASLASLLPLTLLEPLAGGTPDASLSRDAKAAAERRKRHPEVRQGSQTSRKACVTRVPVR
jgi:hypothetical protein